MGTRRCIEEAVHRTMPAHRAQHIHPAARHREREEGEQVKAKLRRRDEKELANNTTKKCASEVAHDVVTADDVWAKHIFRGLEISHHRPESGPI